MIGQKQTKHNYQQAISHWNVLPATGMLCLINDHPFADRMEKIDLKHRPEKIQP